MKKFLLCFIFLISLCFSYASTHDTFTSLKEGDIAPQTFEELWSDYDPRKEPLDAEILEEWEQDNVIIQIIRYRVGLFKGQKSMVAAVYGYPKGGSNLPALVNIHGGGQYADANAIYTNAKRGYATISIAWAGRINSSKYKVTPDTVKLFWENKTEDANYKVTTDWGAIDGYHAPGKNPGHLFGNVKPYTWTIDAIDSPRNDSWYLATLAARRAITYLEQQPQINPEKIGVYGHSMGGKITVLTAASDKRIKAAVPSCGGISNNDNPSELYNRTIGDVINLQNITAPTLFLKPSNDFHSDIYDLPKAIQLIQSPDYRVSSSPHHNHQDTGEYIIAGLLWFDHYLKDSPSLPKTPETKIEFNSNKLHFSVTPDNSWKIKSVDIYYTQQGKPSRTKGFESNPKYKFWHHVDPSQQGSQWNAELPIHDSNKPVWAYANILYELKSPETGANYYYGSYTTESLNLSSVLTIIDANTLQYNEIKATLDSSLIIEDFQGDWRKDWFTYKPEAWGIKTNKLFSPLWQAPNKESDSTKLELSILSEQPNTLVLRIDNHATEIKLLGGKKWQTISISPQDLKNASGVALINWEQLAQLELAPYIAITSKFNHNGIVKSDRLVLGVKTWQGKAPEFKYLRWTSSKD